MNPLPSKIWMHIFNFLPVHDMPRGLIVDKTITKVIIQQLWRVISVHFVNDNFLVPSLSEFISTGYYDYKSFIETVTFLGPASSSNALFWKSINPKYLICITNSPFIMDLQFRFIGLNLSRIIYIELSGNQISNYKLSAFSNLNIFVVTGNSISFDDLYSAIKECTTITSIHLKHATLVDTADGSYTALPNISKFSFSLKCDSSYIQSQFINAVITTCPNLTNLEMLGFSSNNSKPCNWINLNHLSHLSSLCVRKWPDATSLINESSLLFANLQYLSVELNLTNFSTIFKHSQQLSLKFINLLIKVPDTPVPTDYASVIAKITKITNFTIFIYSASMGFVVSNSPNQVGLYHHTPISIGYKRELTFRFECDLGVKTIHFRILFSGAERVDQFKHFQSHMMFIANGIGVRDAVESCLHKTDFYKLQRDFRDYASGQLRNGLDLYLNELKGLKMRLPTLKYVELRNNGQPNRVLEPEEFTQ